MAPPPFPVSGWLIHFVSRSQVTFQELHPIVCRPEFENTISAHCLGLPCFGPPGTQQTPGRVRSSPVGVCQTASIGHCWPFPWLTRLPFLPCPSISQPPLISRKRVQDKGASEVCPLILFVQPRCYVLVSRRSLQPMLLCQRNGFQSTCLLPNCNVVLRLLYDTLCVLPVLPNGPICLCCISLAG